MSFAAFTVDRNYLVKACNLERLDCIDYAVDNGFDINTPSTRCCCETPKTVLMEMCQKSKCNMKVIKKLIERGANPSIEINGQTALIIACNNKNMELMDYLCSIDAFDDYSKSEVLGLYNIIADDSLFEYLLNKGAVVKTQYANNRTFLINAAFNLPKDGLSSKDIGKMSNLDLVKKTYEKYSYLHDNYINLATSEGETALMIACSLLDLETVKYLLSKGSDCNLLDINKKSALFHSFPFSLQQNENKVAHFNCLEIIKLLLNNGVDVNICNVTEHTPLYEAVYTTKKKDIIDVLLPKVNLSLDIYNNIWSRLERKFDNEVYEQLRKYGGKEIVPKETPKQLKSPFDLS